MMTREAFLRSLRNMVHILESDSSEYNESIARLDALPSSCRCSGCGSQDLQITKKRRLRTLKIRGRGISLCIALARCEECGRFERVLPCDVLPGKQFSIETMLSAVVDFLEPKRDSLRAIAKSVGASAMSIRNWCVGLGKRWLDLRPLLSHRAIWANHAAEPVSTTRLVPFSAFVIEALKCDPNRETHRRWEGAKDPWLETVQAASRLAAFVKQVGGAIAAARLGVKLFRAPVLLFRSAN